MSIPDNVQVGGDVVTSIEVDNGGEREGLLLAGLRSGGYPTSLTTSVPVGGMATLTGRLPTPDDSGELQVVVSLPGDDRSYAVRVEPTSTPTDG